MLVELLIPLVKYFTALNIFRYLTFRAAYAAVTALVICLIFGPIIIKKLSKLKASQSIRSDGPKTHLTKSGTPTMGGILIIFSVVISVLLWTDLRSAYVWIALGSFILFGFIGFADDYLKVKKLNSRGLTSGIKLIFQMLIASAVALVLYYNFESVGTRLYLPFMKNPIVDLGIFWIPLAIIYVVYWSNAVNLADGLDGLASGLMIFALLAFSIITYLSGRPDWSSYLNLPFIKGISELTIFNLALVGACVGFLWFNSHPAQVFMGDVGSLALGGVLGVLSIIVKKEVLLLLIGGVFVMEVLSDVLQVSYYKITKGKRLFKMAPIHHHFELSGWSESKVVIRFWILGGIFAILALSTLKIQ